MEFAVVNKYMGPTATKMMKGYSDDDLRSDLNDFKVSNLFIYLYDSKALFFWILAFSEKRMFILLKPLDLSIEYTILRVNKNFC